MAVDVETSLEIARPRLLVADDATDPDHAPRWYVNVTQVTWQTALPLAVGTELAFVATSWPVGRPTPTGWSRSRPAAGS